MLRWWRTLLELRRTATDVIPARFGSHEDMHGQLNSRVSVHAAQGDAVHGSVVRATQRGPTDSTESKAPARHGFVQRELRFPRNPSKRSGSHFPIGGPCAAECLPAARAVTASSVRKWRIDPVANTTTEASTRQHDDVSREALFPRSIATRGIDITMSSTTPRNSALLSALSIATTNAWTNRFLGELPQSLLGMTFVIDSSLPSLPGCRTNRPPGRRRTARAWPPGARC